MPAASACQRCKSRHVKCDRVKPSCGQCVASKQCCPGYAEGLRFVDDGAKVVRKHRKSQGIWTSPSPIDVRNPVTPSLSHQHSDGQPKTRSSLGHPNPSKVAEKILREPTTLDISDEHLQTCVSPRETNANKRAGLKAVGHEYRTEGSLYDSLTTALPAGGAPIGSTVPNSNFNSAPADYMFGSIHGPSPVADDPGLLTENVGDTELGALMSDFMLQSEQEMLFLLRHYTDNLASWLDLFDQGGFFETSVPCLVGISPLLKSATVALAAKHLSRVGGIRATYGIPYRRLAMTEYYPYSDQVDWSYRAANYYYEATTHLRQALAEASIPRPESITRDECTSATTSPVTNPQDRRDSMLAGTAILMVYDMLDNKDGEFPVHVARINALLGRSDTASAGPILRVPPQAPSVSDAAAATFLFCLSHDLLLSSAGDRAPLMEFDAIASPEGVDSSSSQTGTPSTSLRNLFSILSEVVHLIAPQQPSYTASMLQSNTTTTDLHKWTTLHRLLDSWQSVWQSSFEPYARYWSSQHLGVSSDMPELPFSEILFAKSAQAAAMTYYHYGRLLLLLHKPVDHTSLIGRLKGYRQLAEDVRVHCLEICGIAAGRPSAAARIHSVQPLFMAGQCLEEVQERQAVLSLLQDIESDVGWPTEPFVKRLQQEWAGSTTST